MPGVSIRVDAKTGETVKILPNGREQVLPPQSAGFMSAKKTPDKGNRAENSARVRKMNEHLPNLNSNQ